MLPHPPPDVLRREGSGDPPAVRLEGRLAIQVVFGQAHVFPHKGVAGEALGQVLRGHRRVQGVPDVLQGRGTVLANVRQKELESLQVLEEQ